MANRHQIRIEYNPYEQVIACRFKSTSNEWMEFEPENPLYKFNDKCVSFQSVLSDIIPLIVKYWNFSNESPEVIFCGTQRDFDDLEDSVSKFYKESPAKKREIICKKDCEAWYAPAEVLIPRIEEIFASLENDFAIINDELLGSCLKNYKDTVSETIPICVMGTYSAGKSAFINALIGHEILPSSSKPTTAKIFKIEPADDYRIKFKCSKATVNIQVGANLADCNIIDGTLDSEVSDLFNKISDIREETHEQVMYKAIDVINREAVSVQLVEVCLPFHDSSLPLHSLKIEIYDTPGSNAASHKDHLEVLTSALKGRTNGLPVLVVKPDDLDSEDVACITGLIETIGEAQDLNNMIIAVNQSDDKSMSTLKGLVDPSNSTAVISWKTNRLFFVSAAMALGSKKIDGVWQDSDCEMVYETKKQNFMSKGHKYDVSLPLCNRLPENRYAAICREVAAAEQIIRNGDTSESAYAGLIAHNSGIRAVESEITYFGVRHSNYNKCRMAQKFLSEAIRNTQNIVEQRSCVIEEKTQKKMDAFNEKYRTLSQKLEDCTEKDCADADQESAKYISQKYSRDKDEIIKYTQLEVITQCKKHKKDSSKKVLSRKIDDLFANTLDNLIKIYVKIAKEYWKSCEMLHKERMIRVVNDSREITRDEKDFLTKYVMDFGTIKIGKPRFDIHELKLVKESIKLWKFCIVPERIDADKCASTFEQELKRTQIDIINGIRNQNLNEFYTWCQSLSKDLRYQLDIFNPELKRLKNEIDQAEKEYKQARELLDKLSEKNKAIENMVKIQTDRG